MNQVPQIFYNHMRKSHPSEAFRMSLTTKVTKNKDNNTAERARALVPKVRKETIQDAVRLLLYVYMLYQPGYPPEDYPYSYEEMPEWADYYSRDQLVLQEKHAIKVLQEAQRMLRKLFPNLNQDRKHKRAAENELYDTFVKIDNVALRLADDLVTFMTKDLSGMTHAKNAKLVTEMFEFLDPAKIQTKKTKYIKQGLRVLAQTHGNANVGKAMLMNNSNGLNVINRNNLKEMYFREPMVMM